MHRPLRLTVDSGAMDLNWIAATALLDFYATDSDLRGLQRLEAERLRGHVAGTEHVAARRQVERQRRARFQQRAERGGERFRQEFGGGLGGHQRRVLAAQRSFSPDALDNVLSALRPRSRCRARLS